VTSADTPVCTIRLRKEVISVAELGAFSPDMHDENACGAAPPGSPPKWTLYSDAETTLVYGNYRVFTRA